MCDNAHEKDRGQEDAYGAENCDGDSRAGSVESSQDLPGGWVVSPKSGPPV